MYHTLNLHGQNRVRIPDGLPELLSDISRHVLYKQPKYEIPVIADYLEAKLKSRELSRRVSNYTKGILQDVEREIMDYKKYGISEEVANEAAVKIQALYKGYKIRKTISTRKGSHGKKCPKEPSKEKLSQPDDSVNYIKTSTTSIPDSILYPVPSILMTSNDLLDFPSLSSFTSAHSEGKSVIKAAVHTNLPLINNSSTSLGDFTQ